MSMKDVVILKQGCGYIQKDVVIFMSSKTLPHPPPILTIPTILHPFQLVSSIMSNIVAGHSLGMRHDGIRDPCNSQSFIMSRSRGVHGQTQWSSCSEAALKKNEK